MSSSVAANPYALNTFSQTGMEFRDASYVLSAKNNRKLHTGMIFNLVLGFTGLEEGGKK